MGWAEEGREAGSRCLMHSFAHFPHFFVSPVLIQAGRGGWYLGTMPLDMRIWIEDGAARRDTARHDMARHLSIRICERDLVVF